MSRRKRIPTEVIKMAVDRPFSAFLVLLDEFVFVDEWGVIRLNRHYLIWGIVAVVT